LGAVGALRALGLVLTTVLVRSGAIWVGSCVALGRLLGGSGAVADGWWALLGCFWAFSGGRRALLAGSSALLDSSWVGGSIQCFWGSKIIYLKFILCRRSATRKTTISLLSLRIPPSNAYRRVQHRHGHLLLLKANMAPCCPPNCQEIVVREASKRLLGALDTLQEPPWRSFGCPGPSWSVLGSSGVALERFRCVSGGETDPHPIPPGTLLGDNRGASSSLRRDAL